MLSIVGLSLTEAFAETGQGRRTVPGCKSCRTLQARVPRDARDAESTWSRFIPARRDAVGALAARDDVALGIATGKSQRGVRLVLGHHGLIDRFITIKTADDAPSKPNPGMVLAAMREAGATPENTVVVGDTVYDIAMARAAGAARSASRGAITARRARAAGAPVIDTFAHTGAVARQNNGHVTQGAVRLRHRSADSDAKRWSRGWHRFFVRTARRGTIFITFRQR